MIDDTEGLLRRINPEWVQPDQTLMSWAFRAAQLSVDREALRSASEIFVTFGWKCARLSTKRCRELGCDVLEDPEPDNPAHALVSRPEGLTKGRIDALAKALRDSAQWPA